MNKNKKYIVGINLPIKSSVHESGVSLIDLEGNVLFAMNEERLSRKKLDGDFPELSVLKMLEYTKIDPADVVAVSVPTLSIFKKGFRFLNFIFREKPLLFFSPILYKKAFSFSKKESKKDILEKMDRKGGFIMKYFWKDFIKKYFPNAKIYFVDHHIAHASSAYFASPWENALAVTIDGAGNLRSSIVASAKQGKISVIDDTFLPHSVGSFWGNATRACGFRSGTRHGGKTTGLAASGDATKLIGKMRELIWTEGLRIKTKKGIFYDETKIVPDWDSFDPEKLKHYIGDSSREDIAAAAQKRLEEIVVELIKNAIKKTKHKNIVLAGGVFANVLLNQKILEIDGVEDVFIFPAMSDGGIAMGSAFYTLSKINKNFLPKRFVSPYLGPDYKDEEILSALKSFGVVYEKMQNPAKDVAEKIFQGKIVALYQGRMEYGPRALGNRSIMYAPTDPSVNKWLNDKLNRSEFMPFAPVTLFEDMKDCYIGIKDDPIAATYMTMTYNCTEKMQREASACVHIDKTARPQIVRRNDNPYYYDIIKEHKNLSGIPTLINTSFNMHEEPIVCTPEDAIRAFFDSKIDYLVLEDYLVDFTKNQNLKI